mmetsp:Transcript_22808/g.56521  ORF Transcript_22808/g.56521 Transcript_22808/m.56521 type:complete len:402 (+) Transcript_22808:129-1334(+)
MSTAIVSSAEISQWHISPTQPTRFCILFLQVWNVIATTTTAAAGYIIQLRRHEFHELVEINVGPGTVSVLALVVIGRFGSRPLDLVHGHLEVLGRHGSKPWGRFGFFFFFGFFFLFRFCSAGKNCLPRFFLHDFPNRLEGGTIQELLQVTPRIPHRQLGQLWQVFFGTFVHWMLCLFDRQRHDLQASLGIREVNSKQSRKPPQNRIVDVVWPIGCSQHHDLSVFRGDSVPERQKFRLDGVARAVLGTVTGIQKRVEFVDKDNGRRELASQTENGVNELVGLAKPLAHNLGKLDGQKGRLGLLGNRLGQHGLSRPGRPVQQNSTRGLQQATLGKELWLLQRQDGQLPYFSLLFVESPDIGKLDLNVVRVDDVLGNLFFVRGQVGNVSAALLAHEFIQTLFGG